MSKPKHALILAGGQGIRMGRLGEQIPKGFVEIGGCSLIERSLNMLFETGIEYVTIVTGHLGHFYEKLAEGYAGKVKCVRNENFWRQGSLESLRIGLLAVAEPCLLLESDLIYERRALQILLRHDASSSILVSGPTGAGDEVYVWADQQRRCDRFYYMSKQQDDRTDTPLGELVGICQIGKDLRKAIMEHAKDAPLAADYESGMVAVAMNVCIVCVKVSDLLWAEIDDIKMLRRAENDLWPRIQNRQNSE